MKIKKEHLKQLVQFAGYTQNELARRCGASRQAISTWINGKRNAKPANIKKLAEILKCSMADIAEPEKPLEKAALNGDKFAQSVLNKATDHPATPPNGLTHDLLTEWESLNKKEKLKVLSFVEDLKNKGKGGSCPGEPQTNVA
jgi:transcriptional regulator with XRE-family HTH domain